MTSASSTSEGALPFRSPISHNNRAFAFGLFGWLCCTSSVTSPNAATRLLSLFFHGTISRAEQDADDPAEVGVEVSRGLRLGLSDCRAGVAAARGGGGRAVAALRAAPYR